MKWQVNLFTRVIILLLFLLAVMAALYSYSIHITQDVLEDKLMGANLQKLSFVVNQMEHAADQLSATAISLLKDPDIQDFGATYRFENNYDSIKTLRTIEEDLKLRSNSNTWENQITIYSASSGKVISTASFPGNLASTANSGTSAPSFDSLQPDGTEWQSGTWQFVTSSNPGSPAEFVHFVAEPFYAASPGEMRLLIETRFPVTNLVKTLNDFKAGGDGDPFLYKDEHSPIVNSTSDRMLIESLLGQLPPRFTEERGSFPVQLQGETYLVQYERTALDWILLDYVPFHQVLQPITESRRLFYVSTAILLLLSVVASLVLYRQVQVPVGKLVQHLQKVKKGMYSTRITEKGSHEFRFLFQRFNEMVAQIQELFEKVYEEKLRSREAVLKQLQSQINPHFLYNCLYFIKNTAEMGDDQTVVKMALNLGDYYRYTTRIGDRMATLREEIELVRNYLEIQKLRLRRIEYTLDIPENLQALPMLRLILQPVVENAIVHGIEPKPGQGRLTVTGHTTGEYGIINVKDNGIGMDALAMAAIHEKIANPWDEKAGYGVWNVHQRLVHQFGGESGLTFRTVPDGGLCVELKWRIQGGEPGNV